MTGGRRPPAAEGDPHPGPDAAGDLPARSLGETAEEAEEFQFLLHGGRGFILDFQQGRDVINLAHLGLTPWDLLPSINGPDLILAFDGGEVVLKGCAGVHLTQWDFRY